MSLQRNTYARWATPPALGLLLYWGGLTAWFQKDDFAWLGLRLLHVQGMPLAEVLFRPFAQGTIRTLSERVYFLSLTKFFGLNPIPFHLVAFLTFAAATVMLQLVGARLTGSRAAGWWAAIFWTVNAALATPLSWVSLYPELLYALFFLTDVWLFLRFIDTGEHRFLLTQWGTFLLGFLVLEINVVYPALAIVVAIYYGNQSLIRKILPMFLASAVYMAVHFWAAPLPASGPYKLYWDLHIVQTLFTYVNWSLGTGWLRLVNINSPTIRLILATALIAGLAAFAWCRLSKRDWRVLLYPAWFVIVLAPFLPLRLHMQYEYLTVPVIGLALWGGEAIVAGWAAAGWKRSSAILLAAIYLGVSLAVGVTITRTFHDRSARIHEFFERVQALSLKYPGRPYLFTGVNDEIFNDVLRHRAFRLIGINEVYVAPSDSLPPEAKEFSIDPARLPEAVVYDVSSGNVVDITRSLPASAVQMGDVSNAGQLGPTWYPIETGYRWMPKQATVALRGPSSPSEKLYVTGFAPAVALRGGPLKLSVTVDGEPVRSDTIRQPDAFELSFDLPAKLTSKPGVLIQLELDRTFRVPNDVRELGIIISSVAIR